MIKHHQSRLTHLQRYILDKQVVFSLQPPIEFHVDGNRRTLSVKNVIELEIEGIRGADPNKESRVVNSTFGVVPGSDLVVARSSKYNYNDHGLQWNNSGL